MRGKIKTLIADKGIGFISVQGQSKDTYFKVADNPKYSFSVGTEVEFEQMVQSDGKFSAKRGSVKIVGVPEQSNTTSISAYYLPTDTSKFLFSSAGTTIENNALKVEKYIRTIEKLKIKEEKPFSDKEKKLLSAININQRDTLGFIGYTVSGTLGNRMVVGLGSASVFETGIILHKPYGFPYIPGSSIKGAMRNFLVKEYADEFDESDLKSLFGTQTQKGELKFFDAYPVKLEKLELDIMNPHFPKWYNGSGSPTDDDSPNPIKFYAVPAGTVFTFRIGGEVSEKLKKAFADMLEYAGLGAKTAVGYGWFQKVGV